MNYRIFSSLILTMLLLLICTFSLLGQDQSGTNRGIHNFVKMMEAGKDSVDLSLYFMIKELHTLGLNSYQYYIRPVAMGGGGGSYSNYAIPSNLKMSIIAEYSCAVSASVVKFKGTSRRGYGTLNAEIDSLGSLRFLSVAGKFKDKLK